MSNLKCNLHLWYIDISKQVHFDTSETEGSYQPSESWLIKVATIWPVVTADGSWWVLGPPGLWSAKALFENKFFISEILLQLAANIHSSFSDINSQKEWKYRRNGGTWYVRLFPMPAMPDQACSQIWSESAHEQPHRQVQVSHMWKEKLKVQHPDGAHY